ncbi:hypothetical protein [Streptomyces spectabilis]|uniref:hypothetical protein n=1 Tax=Streptomyces spectabilis TaxID=68270 RepID=UPI001CEF6241|nr:hypothetical protein [Streptomyces spectabilis]
MAVDRAGAEQELRRELAVGEAFGGQAGHVPFARRERRFVTRCRIRGGDAPSGLLLCSQSAFEQGRGAETAKGPGCGGELRTGVRTPPCPAQPRAVQQARTGLVEAAAGRLGGVEGPVEERLGFAAVGGAVDGGPRTGAERRLSGVGGGEQREGGVRGHGRAR